MEAELTPCFSRLWLALILYSFCIATVAGNALVILAVVQVFFGTLQLCSNSALITHPLLKDW